MMITIVVIALAFTTVMLLYAAARSRRKQAGQVIHPLDLKAFRTLIDREDEIFLQKKLPRSKFFALKRQRIRVTLRYVSRIAGNASAVMHMSETARASAVPEVAFAASRVMELATQIRLQCLVAMGKLILEYAMPSLQLTPAMLVPKYQTLRDTVSRLGTLQRQNPMALPMAI